MCNSTYIKPSQNVYMIVYCKDVCICIWYWIIYAILYFKLKISKITFFPKACLYISDLN